METGTLRPGRSLKSAIRRTAAQAFSINVQLFLTYLIIMVIAVFVTGRLFLSFAGNYVIERNQGLLYSHAMGYLKYIDTNLPSDDQLIRVSSDYVWKFLGRMNLTLRISDAAGFLVYDSMRRNLPAGLAASGQMAKALSGSESYWQEQLETERFHHFSFPVKRRDRIIAAGDLSVSLWDMDNLISGMHRSFQFAILFSALFAAALAFFFTRMMLKPLRRIKQVATELASGNFSSVLDASVLDDPGELGRTINQIAQSLRSYIMRLTEDKNKTEVLLANMVDGVVALDRESRITFVNNAAVRILKPSKEIEDEDLQEVWPQQDLWDLVDESRRENDVVDKEITRADGTILHVYSVPHRKEGAPDASVMLLMRDITEIRKLESARAQFLNNVSHELKTPLTIIKGFVITLIKSPDIPEDYRRYLEFIDRETDRLTRLVEDLLQIARFRSGREILKLNFCEPREILQHMHTQMAPKAREHRIYLGLDVPDSLPIVLADGDRIKEVLTNLVDNAIKYSPPHSRVDVSGRATEEELIIKVCDNGPGVPAGELPFLFERFFRGDEKRKRASGTGLGLAIVKEIVEAHGGRIKAESEEGKGTTFTVNLPLRKGKKAPAPAAPEESDSEEPQDEEVNGAEVPAEEARTE